MNDTSYQIRYGAMDTFYMQVSQRIEMWKEELAEIQTALDNVVNMEGFSGESADNLRAYVSEVHLLAYQTLLRVMDEYQTRLLLYKDGYYDIDSNLYAVMTKWTMSDYYAKVQQNENGVLSEAETIRQTLMNIGDLVAVGEPGRGTLQENMEYILSETDRLDIAITSHESTEQMRTISSLTDLIDSLHGMLTYYKGLNRDIKGYRQGEYALNETVQTLVGSYQVSMEYLAEHQEAADAAYGRLSAGYEQMLADYKAACEAKEDAGRAEIIMGLVAMVLGTAAIVCVAEAALPVIVVLGTVAGVGSYMYGASNLTEGTQEVYYGACGDLGSAGCNPIRDTVFAGNQTAYDAWGNLNMAIASLCIPISGVVVQGGTNLARNVAVTVAKETLIDQCTDFTVSHTVAAMTEEFGLNQTEQALWTIGLNVGIDKIGDSVTARFNTENFASGMSAADAARYNAWVEGCIDGTHSAYPGLSADDIAKLEIADAHVADAVAVSKVDADAYLNLKAVEYGNGIKALPEGIGTVDADTKALAGAGSEGGSNTLTTVEAEEYAFNAIKGSNNADTVVLGKYESGSAASYDAVAKDMDAQYFNLDNWDELSLQYSTEEIWKINERFLDIQTSSGREIYLSHDPIKYIGGDSYYSKEIQYLIDNGYRFVKEGDIWHAIR